MVQDNRHSQVIASADIGDAGGLLRQHGHHAPKAPPMPVESPPIAKWDGFADAIHHANVIGMMEQKYQDLYKGIALYCTQHGYTLDQSVSKVRYDAILAAGTLPDIHGNIIPLADVLAATLNPEVLKAPQ